MLVDFFGHAPRYHLDDSPLLQRLADSDIEFHLTGSRYRGTPRPDSDFDFFVEADVGDSAATWTALAALDFEQMPATIDAQCYDDDRTFTFAVLQNADEADVPRPAYVQVQLVRSVAAAKKVRDIVEMHFRDLDEALAAAADKSGRRLFWRAVQALVVSTLPAPAGPAIPNTESVAVAAGIEDDDDNLPF